jgi:hypothetical protein
MSIHDQLSTNILDANSAVRILRLQNSTRKLDSNSSIRILKCLLKKDESSNSSQKLILVGFTVESLVRISRKPFGNSKTLEPSRFRYNLEPSLKFANCFPCASIHMLEPSGKDTSLLPSVFKTSLCPLHRNTK